MTPDPAIRDYLSYDPDPGEFRWRKRAGRGRVGHLAGTFKDGYRRITFRGRSHYAAPLAWWFMHGVMPAEIDHDNGIPGDDRLDNLRLATRSQNNANVGKRRNNTSGFKGVFRCGNRWKAQIGAARTVYLGLFATPEDAARAYDAAALEHHGEFARLNFS